MRFTDLKYVVIGIALYVMRADASDILVILSHDGPVVLGGTITLRADLYQEDGSRPSGTFSYRWEDDAIRQHVYETGSTSNTTTFWSISYPAENYIVGRYRVEIAVSKKNLFWWPVNRNSTLIDVTSFLNGHLTLKQSNKLLESSYVSSASETEMAVSLREGDLDYLRENATLNSTFWFIDCEYWGPVSNFTLKHNFSEPNRTHILEALVIASFEKPTPTPSVVTTTVSPITTKNSTIVDPTTTPIPAPTTTTVAPSNPVHPLGNLSFPFVCLNSSVIAPDPHDVYGYFMKEIHVRAPIVNVTVTGTNWLQPWDMLSLKVNCSGTGPFRKCLQYHEGSYNVTKNETCKEADYLESCEFAIERYFIDPGTYTIVMIIDNDIGTLITPLTITVFKATTRPQLSVIVVPVSCSLVAIVVIVFGVAYYIQSRARFTVEVANFDFGQNNPEMEYKTFTERLRDSFNGALRPGGDRISVRHPYYGSMNR